MESMPSDSEEMLQALQELRRRNTELEANQTWLLQNIEQLKKANSELAEKFINRTVELSRERQRLFNILDSLPVHVCMFAPDYKVLFANRAFRAQNGEVNGRSCYEYNYGLDQPCGYCKRNEVLATGQSHQWEFTAPDGRHMKVFNVPFVDTDGSSLVLETSFDQTQQYQLLEELRRSEKRCHMVFQHSPDMISIIRIRDGRYLEVNQRFLECLGYTREEIINKTPAELGIWENELLIDFALNSQMGEINKGHTVEYKIKNKAGQIITISDATVIIYLDHELCRVSMMRDVTREKKLEAGLEKLDRLNIIGQMAASISHEIRNPLTSVRGFLQMLGNYEIYSQDLEYFDLMIEEIDRANNIISEYLGLAREKSLKLELSSLDDIITSLTPMIRSDANQREISVRLELGNVQAVLVYENEIRQLILNLARNGLEAMDSHGELTIGTCVQDQQVVLFVRDQGTGIADEVAEKLATPFFTTKVSGTGLGLSVCYNIAARHQACLDYETGPLGTVFFVRFPAASVAIF